MAIAARALATLSEHISLPPGTIHVSQELEFIDTVSVDDTIICQAKVGRKQERGRLHLLTIDLNVLNQNQKMVMVGKTTFILPKQDGG
jgi:acyl dehydratase